MWRDTAKTVRFLGVDWRGALLLLVTLYHVAYWTLGLSIAGIAALAVLENMGYTLPNAWRGLKVFLMGKRRPAVSSRRRGRSDR